MQTILLGILLVNIYLVTQITGLANFIPVMEEDYTSCMPDKKWGRIDLSDFHLITGKDRIFANGTVRFLKNMKSPIKMEVTTDRLVNGKWTDGTYKKLYNNFCVDKNNRLDPISPVTSKIPNCPIKAGQTLVYNMLPASAAPISIPDSFRGEWRTVSKFTYSDSNGQVEDCATMLLEIVEK